MNPVPQRVVFGTNRRASNHAFRHIDALGLAWAMVMQAIVDDLLPRLPLAIPHNMSPYVGVVAVGAVRLRYHAFPVEDGLVNVRSMLAASRLHKPGSPRHLNSGEKRLITRMVRGTAHEAAVLRDLAHVLVEDMADGGMGSVRFCSPGRGRRQFGQQIAEASFSDDDGVPVSATLNLDQNGALFELDLWKVDNSALLRYPAMSHIEVVRERR